MRVMIRRGFALIGFVAVAGCAGVATDAPARSVLALSLATPVRAACENARVGFAHCAARIREDGDVALAGLPKGYGPQDLWSAYSLTDDIGGGAGATAAIIDAYDDPNLLADVAEYRSTYGLAACGSGCLAKVNQMGGSSLPSPNAGWAVEESLDADMVSALCPNCKILLVEASSASLSDLGAAVSEARTLGATVISTGYNGAEFEGEDAHSPYDAGRPVTAAAGDSGYGIGYPAALPYVTAVGSTTLKKGGGGSRGWTETADGGGGCAQYAKKPAWQHDTFCTTRTDVDAAFVGDPSTGVAIYDSYQENGWLVVGGTSVGAPALAALYALAGNARTIKNARTLYAHASKLYDIPPSGYDEPTGNGTPDGLGAF